MSLVIVLDRKRSRSLSALDCSKKRIDREDQHSTCARL